MTLTGSTPWADGCAEHCERTLYRDVNYLTIGVTGAVISGGSPMEYPKGFMNFYLGRGQRKALLIIALPLLVMGYYGFKIMTSVYKTDLGNGVVIYADDYVKTGRWVFDCKYSRLISREPMRVPMEELKTSEKFTFVNTYILNKADTVSAKEAIQAVLQVPDWYQELRYLYSVLGEMSELNMHSFYLLTHHNGRPWALEIDQSIGSSGKSSFDVTAKPYDPETYVDYGRAFRAAIQSCPVPQ